uniref:Cadherin domain-containing protein n=1 Tax=Anabas testudineus TaxID=64144 RepID=A0A3Q1HY96_ANATE
MRSYREQHAVHNLILTAVDGGTPARSGTASVIVHVLDTNDNAPVFDKSIYNVNIMENSPIGSLVIDLNATDLDEGSNSDIIYSYSLYTSEKTQETFNLNPSSGEITVKGTLNYEDFRIYDMEVIATDHGANSLSGQCTIKIVVEDMNDNHPEISIKSFQSPVNENIELDTVIAVVKILDINDNAPQFRRDVSYLDISEATPKGERFSLSNAVDPDVGTNSVKTYHLSESEYFSIEVQTGRDGSKFADLILRKTLDREKHAVHNLILTSVDGGTPARSGTASVIVRVLDTNDNAPVFDKSIYNVNIMENSPIGSLVIDLNATDLDEGSNSDIIYSYSLYTSEKTQETFNLNPSSGEITSPVNENIELDTVIAVVSVSDKDSGDNGVVDLHIPDNMPFRLRESSDNYYELVVSEPLDREKVPEYDITFTVTDRGSPPLSDNETMTLELLDVNDNVPQFPQSFYTIRVMENNAPGALLSSLTAFDPDLHENQYLVYFIIEKEIANTSMSMLFSINPENGNLYALKTFDYEIEKEFLFHIEARDSGSPPLSSNVTVHIIIVDQNDNAPVIVSPWRAHGSVVEDKIPRSTDKGSLVAKVIALDTDSVHNSRITYQFLQVSDATLFSLDQYNGEIRTMRMFSYRDQRHHRLVVVAKDNGDPALSATVTIKLSTVETAVKAYSDMTEVPLEYDIFSDLNLYLVIGLGSVSFLLLITILVTIVLKCQKPKPSKAAPPCRNSVISERNSTIADSTLVSNDAYWYSLFLAETRKGKLVVRQPKIDRENICNTKSSASCYLRLEVSLE